MYNDSQLHIVLLLMTWSEFTTEAYSNVR